MGTHREVFQHSDTFHQFFLRGHRCLFLGTSRGSQSAKPANAAQMPILSISRVDLRALAIFSAITKSVLSSFGWRVHVSKNAMEVFSTRVACKGKLIIFLIVGFYSETMLKGLLKVRQASAKFHLSAQRRNIVFPTAFFCHFDFRVVC